MNIYILTAFAFGLSSLTWSQSVLRLPEGNVTTKTVSVKDLQLKIGELNRSIGRYPPLVSSESDRMRVYEDWANAIRGGRALQEKTPESEDLFAALADLYRQGHNLDVAGAGEEADRQLQKCLKLFPNSLSCHRVAGYFYLAIHPSFAPKGEFSLRRLKVLLAPKVDSEVERGLAFAQVYQGKKAEAIKQIDYYLTIQPDDKWMRSIVDDLRSGGEIKMPNQK